MVTHMGKRVAAYLNGTVDANPWRDLTVKRIPRRFGPPWFRPFAGAHHKAEDLLT